MNLSAKAVQGTSGAPSLHNRHQLGLNVCTPLQAFLNLVNLVASLNFDTSSGLSQVGFSDLFLSRSFVLLDLDWASDALNLNVAFARCRGFGDTGLRDGHVGAHVRFQGFSWRALDAVNSFDR